MGRLYWRGYNYCNGSNCSDNRGKGFFVVDLSNGNIIWSSTGMTYSIPASPAMADTDADGFIDTVYVGDLAAICGDLISVLKPRELHAPQQIGQVESYICLRRGAYLHVYNGAKDTVGNFGYIGELVIRSILFQPLGGIFMQSRIMIAHRLIL